MREARDMFNNQPIDYRRRVMQTFFMGGLTNADERS
jgi:hypothetical protein